MVEVTRRRPLIVDDEVQIRETLAQYFSRLGYSVDVAADGTEALGKLPQGFEAILTDIRMPGMNGIDFLQQARHLNPGVGVFLITGYPSLDTLIDAKQHGAVVYFRKPLRLMEVDSQLHAFLRENTASLITGRVLVVGEALQEELGERLGRFQVQHCEAAADAFLGAVREQRPKMVLADVADPLTAKLLQAYQKLGRAEGSFLLVCSDGTLDAANELLFTQGAAGCIPREAPQAEVERQLGEVLERKGSPGKESGAGSEGLMRERSLTCAFAKAYRNGYYCLSQGGCPYGPYRGGWIAIEGKEFQKCLKRPLLVDSLEGVGVVAWEGRIEAARAPELRRQLLELIRERKQELIIDAQGLEAAHVSLFELLADVNGELRRVRPDGTLHVINLPETLLVEFTKAMVDTGIHCAGPRMVDEKATFKRWRSRFE